MQQVSHSTLISLLPEGEADHYHTAGINFQIASLAILIILLSIISYSLLTTAFSEKSIFFFYICINIYTLIIGFHGVTEYQRLKNQRLAIGKAGFFASQVTNLSNYHEYKDLFVYWHELRGIVIACDDTSVGAELRFYVEAKGNPNQLLQHRILLEPFVGRTRPFPRTLPIIQSIRQHTGYNILFSCPNRQPSNALPSPETKVSIPWKCIFKTPASQKRTWQF